MKRRALKPCCPTCGRAIPQPKPTRTEKLLTRLWREVYTCAAFALPWPWVPGSFACEPAIMSTGITSEPDTGAWEQTEIAPCAPSYRHERATAHQREAQTGCDDANPCALHRGRIAA